MIEMNEADELSQEILTTQISRVAKRAAKLLKLVALALAIAAFVTGWLNATIDQNEFYGGPLVDFPLKWKIQQFLNGAIGTFGWAAQSFAAATAIEIYGLRSSRPAEAPTGPSSTPAPPPPGAAVVDFAARPTPPSTPPTPGGPPPMKIANDEIWRR
jgi:hypothetical protein